MILRQDADIPVPLGWIAFAIAIIVAGTLVVAASDLRDPEDSSSTHAADELRDRFPDYVPKTSDDTVLNFRPLLGARLTELPEVMAANLRDSIDLLRAMNSKAGGDSGIWVDGQIALGADPREYIPSDSELLTGELGNRIGRFIANSTPQEMADILSANTLHDLTAEYNRFDFRHVDVMGSGRFFYASAPRKFIVLAPNNTADATASGIDRVATVGTWYVMGLKNTLLGARPDETIIRPTIEFKSTSQPNRMQIGGTGSCNVYGGEMQFDGNRISLLSFRQTSRACDIGMDQERQFVIALKEAATFHFAGQHMLVISNGFGTPIMMLVVAVEL